MKSHPVLGNQGDLLSPLTEKLSENGINSIDILSKINFSQKSSIPAEIFIKYIKFDFILAADISSTIWNACHNTKVKIILPIKDIKKLMNDEQSIHLKLTKKQIFINNILGNRVIFIGKMKTESNLNSVFCLVLDSPMNALIAACIK